VSAISLIDGKKREEEGGEGVSSVVAGRGTARRKVGRQDAVLCSLLSRGRREEGSLSPWGHEVGIVDTGHASGL
jgi:hypothetical protein